MSKRINKTRLVACTPQPDGTVHRYPLRRRGGMWWWSATAASSHIDGVRSSLAYEEGGWLEREPNPEYVRQQARPGLWIRPRPRRERLQPIGKTPALRAIADLRRAGSVV